MQHFVNRLALERTAAEAFSGPRTRVYLMAALAMALLLSVDAALAAIWLGLAILVEETRKALSPQLAHVSKVQADAGRIALGLTSAASLAGAPALAWHAGGAYGPAAATAMLALLLVDAALNSKLGRLRTVIVCAPYGLLALSFIVDAAPNGGVGAVLALFGCAGFAAAAVLHHMHQASHARQQDVEWLRQLNMSFGEKGDAAWEINYASGQLIGAENLARVLGRPVSFADVVERGCFASAGDRTLAVGVFTPANGPMRRVALEHAVIDAKGDAIHVRHQGFVRTASDGTPVRLTCISSRAQAEAAPESAISADLRLLSAALTTQAETLRTLSNELSSPLAARLDDKEGADHARRLMVQSEVIDRGVDALAHARHAAESANLAKSQFLANMSHELRTPLNAILGYAEMLQEDAEDNGDTAAVQDLHRIIAAAKHLLSLINEILDLSKIEAGRMEAVAGPFSPTELMDDLIATVRPLAEQNGNRLRIIRNDDIASAHTDSTKLRQCVLNLLSNASKFTRNGAIDVEIERRMHNGVAQMFITVRDTGIGMSTEHLARLFQPFVQADPTITQQYGGTGLGLTITRRLAQLLGGDVSVESTLGGGSRFTLHVPIKLSDAAQARGAAAEIDDIQGSEDGPLVLVIEDEPDARELAARALTRAGFSVLGVGGGEAGLALARSKAPALVLLDIFLPDRSGWRVLQSLKNDPKTQDIPVVVLSVNEDRAHALALGAAEHMVKPADRDKLAATVMRYARKRPAEQKTQTAASVTPLPKQIAG
ncbi:MAG: response regulator [Hyphomonadaceae bacterium]|nr:response regulator [Hyphomonadaceae bacterium]